MNLNIDLDNIENAVVSIAKRTMKRVKQKSYKDFEDNLHIVAEVNMKSSVLNHILLSKTSTTKDIQSKLKEIAVTCILGIEYLDRDNE